MIFSLEGRVVFVGSKNLIALENKGLAYEVFVPSIAPFIEGEIKKIFIYEIENESAHFLVGFLSFEEKKAFAWLLSIPGIGPKIALKILSNISVSALYSAIQNKDIATLKKLPGIGEKSATALLKTLGNKIGSKEKIEKKSPKYETIFLALNGLGFSKNEIDSILNKIDFSLNEEIILKEALIKLKGG